MFQHLVPSWLVLVGEVGEPLGGEVLLEEVCHRDSHWDFINHSIFVPSLLPKYGWNMISQLPVPAAMSSQPWRTLATWNCEPKWAPSRLSHLGSAYFNIATEQKLYPACLFPLKLWETETEIVHNFTACFVWGKEWRTRQLLGCLLGKIQVTLKCCGF